MIHEDLLPYFKVFKSFQTSVITRSIAVVSEFDFSMCAVLNLFKQLFHNPDYSKPHGAVTYPTCSPWRALTA